MREQVVNVTLEPGEIRKVSFKATLNEEYVYDIKGKIVGREVDLVVAGKRNVTLNPLRGTLEIEKL